MNLAEFLIDVALNTNATVRIASSRLNLTASQAFHLLSIPFDGISMSNLAHKLGLDTSTLTRNVQVLARMGLVDRKPDNYDKRVIRLVLTNEGSKLLKLLEELLEDKNREVLEKIDLVVQEDLLTVLEKLSWALNCSRDQ